MSGRRPAVSVDFSIIKHYTLCVNKITLDKLFAPQERGLLIACLKFPYWLLSFTYRLTIYLFRIVKKVRKAAKEYPEKDPRNLP